MKTPTVLSPSDLTSDLCGSMKPYRKWLLLVPLAWLLLFLSLLCHFLDLRSPSLPQSRSAAESALTRTETRRLASVQGGSLIPAGVSGTDWRRKRTDYRSRSKAYYRSRSLEILQRLWTGNLTAGMLSPRLQKVLKAQLSSNRHQVVYRGPGGSRKSGLQLYCELKRRTRIRTVDGTEEPFSSLGWARLVPSVPLQEHRTSQYQSCAVVTSAGGILNSSLGREIGESTYRTGGVQPEGLDPPNRVTRLKDHFTEQQVILF